MARILSLKPHPNADQLSLCEVTTGDAIYPVVCGAKNIRVGDIVPLAQVGATLPGDLSSGVPIIRGEVSEGMLCSEEELGIGDDASGIMILPSDLPLGKELGDVLNLRDAVLDIGVTPNRADCLSIVGVAREWAAITGKKLRYPAADVIENDEDIREITSVSILDPDLCPRYTARIIKNVRIGPSPFWMQAEAGGGRTSPHQQYRGCDQLRDDGTGTAPACLRFPFPGRRADRGPEVPGGRAVRFPRREGADPSGATR